MPGAPGMLSTASPRRAITSTTFSGGTPSTSTTLAGSRIRLSFCGLRIFTVGVTNCIMSLSPQTMKTSCCCSAASRARVPITSSASKPSASRIGNAQGLERAANVGNLAAQILGHGGAIGLVALVADLVEALRLAVPLAQRLHGAGPLVAEDLAAHVEDGGKVAAAESPGAAS